jgi:hypothetical protein
LFFFSLIFIHFPSFLLYLIIQFVESPSRETDSRSSSQDISHLLWNPKVHYCVH